jgi:hypothetical protein
MLERDAVVTMEFVQSTSQVEEAAPSRPVARFGVPMHPVVHGVDRLTQIKSPVSAGSKISLQVSSD